jgi:2-polyprenyl-3-methyl-5-hydroxy-6-metoxy-1,4-benzoquinol methylase
VASYIDKDLKILDLGCGPGQFARMLFDMGLKNYRGIDFSAEAIRLAKKTGGNFVCDDILKCDYGDYDIVVCLETLEHIPGDLAVIRRIKKGKKIIFSVPDYESPTHVRVFKELEEVRERYGADIMLMRPFEFIINKKGNSIFLCKGTKK